MKEVKLTIPDRWSDITIETYQKYVEIQESKDNDKKKIIKSLSLLCNTTPFVVKKMAYKDLLEIMGICSKMKNMDFVRIFQVLAQANILTLKHIVKSQLKTCI